MPVCYIVPGFVSSELYDAAQVHGKVWLSYTVLGLGDLDLMRLDASATGPGAPGGVACVAGDPLPNYYATPQRMLADQLAPHGYSVTAFGWDWRMSLRTAGQRLAARIRAEVHPSEPCTIAAHSMGGIVARGAWYELVQSGHTSLVRRIVTLGTPHWGTYSGPELFCGASSTLDQILYLNLAVVGLAFPVPGTPGAKYLSTLSIQQIAATWLPLYESFPSLGEPGDPDDPHREELYQHLDWPEEMGVSESHLVYARDTMGPWLHSADSMPPAYILTTVGGTGYLTGVRLDDPELLGTPQAIGRNHGGDGTVTTASALIADSAQYTITCIHQDQPVYTSMSGQLRDWILAERSPAAPPPPAVVDPAIVAPMVTPAPMALTIGGATTGGPCAGGACTC